MWKERQTGAFYKNTLNHSALALSIVNNKNSLFITPVQNNSGVVIYIHCTLVVQAFLICQLLNFFVAN